MRVISSLRSKPSQKIGGRVRRRKVLLGCSLVRSSPSHPDSTY